LKNSARSFQVGCRFHPGRPYPDILIKVPTYWNTLFNTTGPLFLGFHRQKGVFWLFTVTLKIDETAALRKNTYDSS